MERMTGIIFSDLGLAASFMALDWVQESLKERLGFSPFPATLNLRPEAAADAEVWRRVQSQFAGTPLAPAADGFCSARLYRVEIDAPGQGGKIAGAILLPAVKNYPRDKIEIVAPVRLKDHFGVGDGDPLILEFLN